ncbi:hypothetical protein D3C71_1697460 [compost metagenome]
MSTVRVQVAQGQVGGVQIADQLARATVARRIEDRPPQDDLLLLRGNSTHRRQARTTAHGFIERIDREVQATHFHHREQQREDQQANESELNDIGTAHLFAVHHSALMTVVATSGMLSENALPKKPGIDPTQLPAPITGQKL